MWGWRWIVEAGGFEMGGDGLEMGGMVWRPSRGGRWGKENLDKSPSRKQGREGDWSCRCEIIPFCVCIGFVATNASW